MASGLNKTKRRIASIRSTQKITKAMEMVATVKLKRYKDAHFGEAEYLNALEAAMGSLFVFDPKGEAFYSTPNESAEGNLFLFITSDLGLCAAYNSNLYRFLDSELNKERDTVLPIGDKGLNHLLHEGGYRLLEEEGICLRLSSTHKQIAEEAEKLKTLFDQGRYRSIRIVYTHYVNSLRFLPQEKTLLPIGLDYVKKPEEEYCPPLFEPSPSELISSLMGQYLSGVLEGALDEAQLSEQASRRNAMDSANDNAEELLKQLSVEYNKARQASITQEITEVVSGANNAK